MIKKLLLIFSYNLIVLLQTFSTKKIKRYKSLKTISDLKKEV